MHPMSTVETVFKTPGIQWYRKPREKKESTILHRNEYVGVGVLVKYLFLYQDV